MSSTNPFLKTLPKVVVDEINTVYSQTSILFFDRYNLIDFFVQTRNIDLFLNHFVTHEIDPEIIYDIAWRLCRLKKGITEDQKTRILDVRDKFLMKRKDQRKEIQKQIVGIKRNIYNGITDDRESNKKQKLETGNYFAIIKSVFFDSVTLATIFNYLSHYTQIKCRLTCKGFNSAYLSAPDNFVLINDNIENKCYRKSVLSIMISIKDKNPEINISKEFLDIERIRIMKSTIPNWAEENYDSEMNTICRKFLQNVKYHIIFHNNDSHITDNVLSIKGYYIKRTVDHVTIRDNVLNFISYMNDNISDIKRLCPKTLCLYHEHVMMINNDIELPSVKFLIIIDHKFPTERKQSLSEYNFSNKNFNRINKIFPNCQALFLTHNIQKDNEFGSEDLGHTYHKLDKRSIWAFTCKNIFYIH